MVYLSRNWRNAFFVPVFLLFALFSGAYAYALAHERFELARDLHNFVFYLIVHVVLVVGGRVIPFFSDRRLKRNPTTRYLLLELLALMSSRAGWFNRLNFLVFRSRTLSRLLYPILVLGRRLLLRLLGRSPLQ